jgi:hypothetical protein
MRAHIPVILVIPSLLAGVEGLPPDWDFRLDVSAGAGRMSADVDYSTEAKPQGTSNPLMWTERSRLSQGSGNGQSLRLGLDALFSERLGHNPLRLLWGAAFDISNARGLSLTAQVADPDNTPNSQNGRRFGCDVSSLDLVGGPALGLGLMAGPRWRFDLLASAGYGISEVSYTSAQALVSGDPVGGTQTSRVLGRMRTWTMRLTSAWRPGPDKAVTLGLGWTTRQSHARYVDYNASLVSNPGSTPQSGIFKEDLEISASVLFATVGLSFNW